MVTEIHPSSNRYATRVAALVLTHNHEHFISASLKSILSCNVDSVHIWVLDDGSTDGTRGVVEEIAKQTDQITIISQPYSNGRISLNSQHLLEASDGEYVLFMSGDDMLAPCYPLTQMIKMLDNNERLDLLIPRLVYLMQDPEQRSPAIYETALVSALRSGQPYRVLQDHLYRKVSRLFLQGILVRRQFINNFGGFDTQLIADDYAFVFRMFNLLEKSGHQFHFLEDAIWLYRVHHNNVQFNSLRQLQLVLEVVVKYVPHEYWANFSWDTPPLKNTSELEKACALAQKTLAKPFARQLMLQLATATFKAARRRGDRVELVKAAKSNSLQMDVRISALIEYSKILTSPPRATENRSEAPTPPKGINR